MTAREVIKILKNNYPKTCRMVNGRYQGGFDDTESDFGQALTMAISALEEIQQYREIGTVEECRADREKQSPKNIEKYEKENIVALSAIRFMMIVFLNMTTV